MRTLIAYLMLSCTAFAGAPPSEPYTREVKVPSAGWYRVPVDGHIWRYAHGRVLAFDEGGKMLPCGILPVDVPSSASEEAQPRLVKVEEESGHLVIYLQVDRLAGKHDRLIFDFGGADLLEQVALWGSLDGHEWKAMAQGTLFRLGSGERMQGTALDYPASSYDQLKLVLPMDSGELKQAIRDFRVGNIRLHYAPDDAMSSWVQEPVNTRPGASELEKALTGEDRTLIQLDLPPNDLAAVRINLALKIPHAPVPISLLKMDRGIPQWAYSCVLDTDASSFPIPGGRLESPSYLKIPREHAGLGQLMVQRPREEIVIYAKSVGQITLAYGGAEKRATDFPAISRRIDIENAILGPVVEHQVFLSRELTAIAHGKAQKDLNVMIQWELGFPIGTEPDQWVSVELTPELESSVMEKREGAWGIIGGGTSMQSFVRIDPMPQPMGTSGMKFYPESASSLRISNEIIWSDHAISLGWMALSIKSHGEPVKATVEFPFVFQQVKRIPGEPSDRPWQIGGVGWIECGPWTTDCRTIISLDGKRASKALITLEGKEIAPPTYLDVSIWRVRKFIFFPKPKADDVRLYFGTAAGGALAQHFTPDYLPWKVPPAKLGSLIYQQTQKRSWDRILFIAGLVLAVAALLYLIIKLLPRRQEG